MNRATLHGVVDTVGERALFLVALVDDDDDAVDAVEEVCSDCVQHLRPHCCLGVAGVKVCQFLGRDLVSHEAITRLRGEGTD